MHQLGNTHNVLPLQQLVHIGEEHLLAGLAVLIAKFTVGESELITNDTPLRKGLCGNLTLISRTCSHLP